MHRFPAPLALALALALTTTLPGCINTDSLSVPGGVETVDVTADRSGRDEMRGRSAAGAAAAAAQGSDAGLSPSRQSDVLVESTAPLTSAAGGGGSEEALTPLTPADASLTAQLEADLREAGIISGDGSQGAASFSSYDGVAIVGGETTPDTAGGPSHSLRPDPAAAGAELPVYASSTAERPSSCTPDIDRRAESVAFALTQSLLLRSRVARGQIYVAPTMIPSQYTDCIPSLKLMISHAIQTSESFEVIDNRELDEGFEIFSSTAVPALIRSCKQLGIPYIAVSSIRKAGQEPALTIRFIRVQDGITLFQSYQKLFEDGDSTQ